MARFDRERKLAETEVNRSRALNSQVLTFSKTETELRNQLNIYVEKFKQVRSRLLSPRVYYGLVSTFKFISRIFYIYIYIYIYI
jgi:hypothetical protein